MATDDYNHRELTTTSKQATDSEFGDAVIKNGDS